jgi:hypothetical protein
LIYSSGRGAAQQLLAQPIDASAAPRVLVSHTDNLFAASSSADGLTLVYVDSPPTDIRAIRLLSARGGEATLPEQSIAGDWPVVSPDGRWLAFIAYDSGRSELFVQPFPGPGVRRQITFDGAREPVWRRDGRELFYRRGVQTQLELDPRPLGTDALFTLPFDPVRGLAVGQPVLLFRSRHIIGPGGVAGYDVSPDGRRFLMIKPAETELAPIQLNVVTNWGEELVRRLPPHP